MKIKRNIGYWSQEYKVIYLGLLGFLLHLVDEIISHADTPPLTTYIVIALAVILYPIFSRIVRSIITIGLGIALIAGMSGGHFIPYLTRGYHEGIGTAVITSIIGLGVTLYGVKLFLLALSKRSS